MSDDTRLERLEPLVGEWRIEAPAFTLPPEVAGKARTSFKWALGGAFLLQRISIPVPGAPEALSVIAQTTGTATPSTTSTRAGSSASTR
jgi:hypothetical protein